MAILAHRGDMTHWPENTLESVVAASRSAADGIEFDVGLSADGTWWLMHDQTLDKTTAASGAIRGTAIAELAALTIDGGSGYSVRKDVHLVRLSAVLQAFSNYDGKLVVDVKEIATASGAGIAKKIADRRTICPVPVSRWSIRRQDGGKDLTTIMLTDEVSHADVDMYLADAREIPHWWPAISTD